MMVGLCGVFRMQTDGEENGPGSVEVVPLGSILCGVGKTMHASTFLVM